MSEQIMFTKHYC